MRGALSLRTEAFQARYALVIDGENLYEVVWELAAAPRPQRAGRATGRSRTGRGSGNGTGAGASRSSAFRGSLRALGARERRH